MTTGPAGEGRADDFAVPGECGEELDTNFKVDLTVQVNRDVPACPWDLLGADDLPHRATGGWNDRGELL